MPEGTSEVKRFSISKLIKNSEGNSGVFILKYRHKIFDVAFNPKIILLNLLTEPGKIKYL